MNILQILKEKGYDTVPADFYTQIDVWKSWYDGNVKNFHSYNVWNGKKTVQCRRYTMGMGKKVAEDWANLLMNEKVKITLEGTREQEFFDRVCRENNFNVKANEMQELKAAFGTAAYVVRMTGTRVWTRDRPWWSRLWHRDGTTVTGFGKIIIDYVTAQNIFPLSWENGIVEECAFKSSVTKGGSRYLYLQIHRKKQNGNYVVENSIYEDQNGNLTETALSSVPGFESMAPSVETNSPRKLFVIDRLNIANNVDHTLPMGIPVFANAIDQIKGVDFAYDSYVNEFVVGKKRVMVQIAATKDINGNPAFDPNELIFYVLPEDIGNGSIIQPIDMNLRTADHSTGLQDMLNAMSSRCGLGKNYYKFDSRYVTTATQVISENQDLQAAVHKHGLILKEAMIELARIILHLGNSVLGMGLNENTEIKVELDDSIFVNREAVLNDMRLDVSAGLLKGEIYIAEKYGCTVETARKMMPSMEDLTTEPQNEVE